MLFTKHTVTTFLESITPRFFITYLTRAAGAWMFDFDSGQNDAFFASRASLLNHLSTSAKLDENHLGMPTAVIIGMVKTHFEQ